MGLFFIDEKWYRLKQLVKVDPSGKTLCKVVKIGKVV